MTTTHIEVTLEQMLQIALGTPQITNINLSVLHSFFDILLKKLNCQYEKVEVDGLDGACMQAILRQSRISSLPFNHEQIEIISNKLVKLADLQKNHTKLANSLREHMAHIRACNDKHNERYEFKNWEKFSASCEGFCITSGGGAASIDCKLIRNFNFIKKIKEFVEEPLVGPIIDMRRRLESLHVELIDYQRRLKAQCNRLSIINLLADKIEKLGRMIAIEEKSFNHAMIELQDMIDCKMYKVVLPAIKKYIKTESDKIDAICKVIEKRPSCAITQKLAGESAACLSCSGKLICTQRPIMISNTKRAAEVKDVKKRKIAQACSRFGPCLGKDMEQNLLERLKVIEDATEEAKIAREMKQSCVKLSDHLEFVQGTDGGYYRKA